MSSILTRRDEATHIVRLDTRIGIVQVFVLLQMLVRPEDPLALVAGILLLAIRLVTPHVRNQVGTSPKVGTT